MPADGLKEIAALTVALTAIGLIAVYSVRLKAPPMPSSRAQIRAMLGLLPDAPGRIVEIGSGWGDVALALWRRDPDVDYLGYELSPIPYAASILRARLNRCAGPVFRRRDGLHPPLSGANIVICYLTPWVMEAVAVKLGRELLPGSVVICNGFALPGWTPDRRIGLNDRHRTVLYRYVVGKDAKDPGGTAARPVIVPVAVAADAAGSAESGWPATASRSPTAPESGAP